MHLIFNYFLIFNTVQIHETRFDINEEKTCTCEKRRALETWNSHLCKQQIIIMIFNTNYYLLRYS